jgi:cell shape-determining protein MreC
MKADKVLSFIGSLLVMTIALSIFFMLMRQEMPSSNRELLIAFVSAMFGAMATSIKKITGDDDNAALIRDLEKKNQELQEKVKALTPEQ